MLTWIWALGLLATKVLGDTQQELDDAIAEVFGEEKNINSQTYDKQCTCVPYYRCPNGTINTDGTGLLDIRGKVGTCDDYMEVCCENPLDETKPIKPAPIARKGCGQRNPDGVGFRITGNNNNEAQFGEFPWMVALLKKTVLYNGTEQITYHCGGALVHQQVVLTAAHCVNDHLKHEELIARVGEWDAQTQNEIYPHQNIRVANVFIHDKFNLFRLQNDFALLVLEKPVELRDNVDVICLPTAGVVPLSRDCIASGWGKESEETRSSLRDLLPHRRPRQILLPAISNVLKGVKSAVEHGIEMKNRIISGVLWPSNKQKSGQYQRILKKIDLPMVDHNHCEHLLKKASFAPFFQLHESFVCAGGIAGKDTCKGDGGSPLVCPVEGKPGTYELTGLVSWGIKCGDETPGVYAGVAYARPWINYVMRQLEMKLDS